jgi:ketosteroid isomerase-like protein
MTNPIKAVAEAFSSHRFREAYDSLAPDVAWVSVGGSTTRGKDAVVAVCEETLSELAETTTEFVRFCSVADDDTAAVDVVGRYTDADGNVSVVASCDVFETTDGRVARITSYTVELEPSEDAGSD